MIVHRAALLLSALLLGLSAWGADAADPVQAAPAAAAAADTSCVIVLSQGRNLSTTDPQVNTMWNRVNDSFGEFVRAEFERNAGHAVWMRYPVEATDAARTTDDVLRRASIEHCTAVAEVSMYADQATRQFVSAIKVRPIEETRVQGGTNLSAGAGGFQREQRDPLTRQTLDRLVPSDIARAFVSAYLSKP